MNRLLSFVYFFFLLSVFPLQLLHGQVVGTSEPVEEVNMSFPESGIIESISVKEGQFVKKGQQLAKLDTRMLDVSLRLARIKAESQASKQSAQANWNLRKRRYDELNRLSSYGSANRDEVARAKAEFEIAEANLATANEEAESRKIEMEQIATQIARHTLVAPFDGVISKINRSVSESTQPGQEPVLTIVQLHELHLVLHFDHHLAKNLKVGEMIRVKPMSIGLDNLKEEGSMAKVVFISPVTDQASGTTRVKLSMENSDNQHRAGLKYLVDLSDLPEFAASNPDSDRTQ